MARVSFTANLQRHVACPPVDAGGVTVREALDGAFAVHPAARSYVLDEHGALRHHVVGVVAGMQVADRARLSDPIGPSSQIHVMQALSGG
jgi:hypothetical protein